MRANAIPVYKGSISNNQVLCITHIHNITANLGGVAYHWCTAVRLLHRLLCALLMAQVTCKGTQQWRKSNSSAFGLSHVKPSCPNTIDCLCFQDLKPDTVTLCSLKRPAAGVSLLGRPPLPLFLRCGPLISYATRRGGWAGGRCTNKNRLRCW